MLLSYMNNLSNLPKKIPIFPLSNFIFFPNTSVPLNIFEPRYLQMINDSIKKDKLFGMVQPKSKKKNNSSLNKVELYSIGCIGKIINFSKTEDGRIVLVLKGISRFKINSELVSKKLYREFNVSYNEFLNDTKLDEEGKKFLDIEEIFENLKKLFKKKGYLLNWDQIKKQSLEQTINTFCMISPFSLEEKQMLLETRNIKERKHKLKEIISTCLIDNFEISTIQ